MVKQVDGSFELTVPLPADTKVFYKYVVDGEWLTNSSQKVGNDESGIENNILESDDFAATSATGSKIPEAGGLAVASGVAATGAAAASSDKVKTTVMPHVEQKQTTLGEPGIFVPKDPEALAAFETVRDVDPKTLNEPEAATKELTPEEKKKQKKKLKRSQYKAKKKLQKLGAAGVSTAESTTEAEATPEPETLDPAVVGAIGGAGAAGVVAGAAAGTDPIKNSKELAPGAAPETMPGSLPEEAAALKEEAKHKDVSKEGDVAQVAKSDYVEPTVEPAIKEPIESDKASVPFVAETAVASETVAAESPLETPVERAPVAAESAPAETPVVAAAPVETPVDAPVTEAEEAPESKGAPLAATALVAPVVAETAEPAPTPAPVAEPVHEVVTPVVAQPDSTVDKVDTEAVERVEPVANGAPVVASQTKEVDASPVKGKAGYDSGDEIIIAQGGNIKDIQQQIVAENGDVSIEEIKPTPSEAKRLADEAKIPEQKTAPAKTTPKTATKEEKKKKKGGFISKLKKIFK